MHGLFLSGVQKGEKWTSILLTNGSPRSVNGTYCIYNFDIPKMSQMLIPILLWSLGLDQSDNVALGAEKVVHPCSKAKHYI